MLNTKQRGILSEKLADLGNIAIGSLVFGYVMRSDAFNAWTLLVGFLIAIITYLMALGLEK